MNATSSLNPNCHVAFISIGSNMGNKPANCRNAIVTLQGTGVGKVIAQSKFYCTEPVDYIDQDWFLNAAIKIETPLEPLELLTALQQIQKAGGRERGGIRFGPRLIDLDIIFYDDLTFEDERLMIPHPRMHKRRFVLQPICDIDPQIVHPVFKQSVSQLIEQIKDNDQRIRHYPCGF
jgi:2-amino-4-hydroxy-6-hydroxymethyldihydropteridine diphosphokinase